jgi:hypothetical protein
MKTNAALAVLASLIALWAAPARAQGQVEIRATTPPQPRFEIVEPGPATREATKPREHDFYRDGANVRHEPAFIEPFTGITAAGNRYGLSGWTAPPPPAGAHAARAPWANSGWFALGVSFTWDAPPLPGARPAPRAR